MVSTGNHALLNFSRRFPLNVVKWHNRVKRPLHDPDNMH